MEGSGESQGKTMSRPWRIEVTEYHGRATAIVLRPVTGWRGKEKWQNIGWFGSATAGNWHSAVENVVSYAKEHVPQSAEVQVVVDGVEVSP